MNAEKAKLTEVEARAWRVLGMLDRLRKKYPEARGWSEEARDVTKYIVTGRKINWIAEYLKQDESR